MSHFKYWAILLFGLAEPAYAQYSLIDLAATDPNRFVSEIQRALKESGRYEGSVNGTLNRTTIAAINNACRVAGVLSECQRGPLSLKGATAVVQAIVSVPRGSSTGADVTVPVEHISTFNEASEPIQWMGDGRNGLLITIDGDGPRATIAIAGTAGDAEWSNIYSSAVQAVPGQKWRLVVSSSTDLTIGASATVRVLLRDGTKYLGELAEGAVMAGSNPSEYVVSGTVPDGADKVVPYIQLIYPERTVAEDVISILDATFYRVD